MNFKTGDGMYCCIPPHAIVKIQNYRTDAPSSDRVLKNMCEVTLIDGSKIVAEGSALEKYSNLLAMMKRISAGDANAL